MGQKCLYSYHQVRSELLLDSILEWFNAFQHTHLCPFASLFFFIIFWYVYLPSNSWGLSDKPDSQRVVKRATIHADRDDPSPEVMSFHPDITDCEQAVFRSKIRAEERKEELAVGREPTSLICHERCHAHLLTCFAQSRSHAHLFCVLLYGYSSKRETACNLYYTKTIKWR